MVIFLGEMIWCVWPKLWYKRKSFGNDGFCTGRNPISHHEFFEYVSNRTVSWGSKCYTLYKGTVYVWLASAVSAEQWPVSHESCCKPFPPWIHCGLPAYAAPDSASSGIFLDTACKKLHRGSVCSFSVYTLLVSNGTVWHGPVTEPYYQKTFYI